MKRSLPTTWLAVLLFLAACGPANVAEQTTPRITQLATPGPIATRTPASPAFTHTPTIRVATPTPPPPTSTPQPTPTQPIPTDTPVPPTATVLVVTAQPRTATQPVVQAAATLQYFFPVQPFHVATYGSCHHDYPASDIFVPKGTSFVAVTDGVVDAVTYEDTWNPQNDDPSVRGGLSVALVGSDGVRYYGSHLATIADGIAPRVHVTAGQLLGTTGNSGNAASTPPHLHFGISPPTTPDDWRVRRGTINPLPYLSAWKSGKNLTPDLSRVGGGSC